MSLFNYYLKRIHNNQTIRLDQNCWEILAFNKHFRIDSLKPEEVLSHFQKNTCITYRNCLRKNQKYKDTIYSSFHPF